MTDDDDAFRSHPPDWHLAHHQLQAVHDFFNRVARTHADLHKCSTCFEQYYGMHMSGTECDRCSREVCMLSFMLLSLWHSVHSPRRSLPATGTASKITQTLVSFLTNFKGILNGITQMEEMLCSLASLCFIMWVSKGGQYKVRGNVITFSQDVSTLCTVLPHLPEELDVLIIRKTDSQTTPSYKDFRVRKSKVYALLCFLQQHNPSYRDITIQPPQDSNLPDDDTVFGHLPCLPTHRDPDSSLSTHGSARSHTDDTGEPDFECDELVQEINSFIPSLTPLPSEQDAISSALHLSRLTPSNASPLPWPPTGPALSKYTTCNLFTMAFPTLFPLGVTDPSEDRP